MENPLELAKTEIEELKKKAAEDSTRIKNQILALSYEIENANSKLAGLKEKAPEIYASVILGELAQSEKDQLISEIKKCELILKENPVTIQGLRVKLPRGQAVLNAAIEKEKSIATYQNLKDLIHRGLTVREDFDRMRHDRGLDFANSKISPDDRTAMASLKINYNRCKNWAEHYGWTDDFNEFQPILEYRLKKFNII